MRTFFFFFSRIKKWAAKFRRGRNSLEDDPREGRPKSATTSEIIEQVHDMLLDDRRMKVRKIAETIGISKECVRYILHEELDMKKSFAQDGCRACSQQIKNAFA
jgi:transposase